MTGTLPGLMMTSALMTCFLKYERALETNIERGDEHTPHRVCLLHSESFLRGIPRRLDARDLEALLFCAASVCAVEGYH